MHPDIDLLIDSTDQQADAHSIASAWQTRSYVISAAQPVVAANEYIEKIARDNHHLLVLLEPVLLSDEALSLLASAFDIDPYFGAVMPRLSHAATGEVLKLSPYLGDPDIPALPPGVLQSVPSHYILPEAVNSCFLVRNSLLTNLNRLDESYRTLAGAFQHYLWRARRCGFRCAVINRAIVPVRSTRSFVVDRMDANRLHREHPDFGLGKSEFAQHSLHVHEGLLGRALSPNRSKSRTLLIDGRSLPIQVNGTLDAFLGLCTAISRLNHDWVITILAAPALAEAHKLAARFPNWKLIHELTSGYFTVALRPSQPWDIGCMIDLHQVGLFNIYTILDNIAWDILYSAAPGLGATWNFLAAHADAIIYISEFSRDRFEARFPDARATPGYVSHLSFDPADYTSSKAEPTHRSESILIVGNTFDHKNLAPTVDLVSAAFPSQHIIAFGLKQHGNPMVQPLESGEVAQAEVDRLFQEAKLVVFPSFYEGFGLPVLKALSSGSTILARESDLLYEVAARYRGPGRLIAYRNGNELAQAIRAVMDGSPVFEVPLGTALRDAEKPKSWKEIAAGVLGFVEQLVENVDQSHWLPRQSAIEQLESYAFERLPTPPPSY